MSRRKYSLDEICAKLARVDDFMRAGASLEEAAQRMGVHYATIYQWRRRLLGAANDRFPRVRRGENRVRTTFTLAEICAKLNRAEDLIANGASVPEAAEQIGVKYTTLYQWRRRFPESAALDGFRRVRKLEAENARLRKALAELDVSVPSRAARKAARA